MHSKIRGSTFKDLDRAIGQNIRRTRELKGLTQQDLAELLGIRYQQIQKYERGLNRVSSSALFHLSQIFQIPIESFFLNNTSYTSISPKIPDKEIGKIIEAFSKIEDPKIRAKILAIAKTLAAE